MRMFCLVTIGCAFCIGLALLACTEPPGYGFIVHSVFIDETGPRLPGTSLKVSDSRNS